VERKKGNLEILTFLSNDLIFLTNSVKPMKRKNKESLEDDTIMKVKEDHMLSTAGDSKSTLRTANIF
jgi:ribonucleotide monophosphatase NagD (HAD superfamily)